MLERVPRHTADAGATRPVVLVQHPLSSYGNMRELRDAVYQLTSASLAGTVSPHGSGDRLLGGNLFIATFFAE